MENFRPIPEEIAKAGLKTAGASFHGETLRTLINQYPEGGEAQQKHPVEAEFVGRMVVMGCRLDEPITEEIVNKVGMSLLAELDQNGLLQK